MHVSWIAVFLALAMQICHRTVAKRSAELRYGLSLLLLLSLPVISVTLFACSGQTSESQADVGSLQTSEDRFSAERIVEPSHGESVAFPDLSEIETPSVESSATESLNAAAHPFPWEQWLVALYVCGVGTMLLRLLLSSFGVLRYQRLARRIPDVACQDVLSRLARQIQLSVVPVIAICSRVAMPVVCGVFHSVILVPQSVASGLTTEQFEAVLLHELIHIRRRDALAL